MTLDLLIQPKPEPERLPELVLVFPVLLTKKLEPDLSLESLE
jgi:hypothetical protein